MEIIHALIEDAVRIAGVGLKGAEGVGDFVHHIAAVERVEDAEEEVEIHFEAGFGIGLAEAAGLLEQEDAETVEPGVAEGEAVFGLIHSETAGAAGAGGEEDVLVNDLLLAETLLFKSLEILNEVTHGEIGGVALAVVPVLFAGLEGPDVRRRDGFGAVAEAFERAVDKLLMLPSKTAEQEGSVGAVGLSESALDGALKVMGLPFYDACFVL
jgi:hypothetical protein